MRRLFHLTALLLSVSLCGVAAASAATLEPVGSFDRPIFVTSDPQDPDRLLVVEREGRVVLVEGSATSLLAGFEPLVSCCSSERGLLSIAPAPDFATSGRFYAFYTGTEAAGGELGDIHVDAFRPGGAPGTPLREEILSIGHADHPNHHGGQLQLGPDGLLYVSTGDGGGAGDPLENGQNLETLLGKILRVDPRPGESPPYEIPAGNPFAGGSGLDDEIWSYGLRNPWRFSFDRLGGDLVVADVGQKLREEVNHALSPGAGEVGGAGANYGWNCREGLIPYAEPSVLCAGAGGFTDPVFDYPHDDPGGGAAHGCSITGGYVVRDPGLGDLYGRYVYADFCEGEIRSLALPGPGESFAKDDRSEGLAVASPVSFGEDSSGRLYVVSNGGEVYRLVGGAPPTAGPPVPVPVPIGSSPSRRRPHLRLGVERRGAGGALLRLTVWVTPCPELGGRVVRLKRGGVFVAAKRLDGDCKARFRARVRARSTFRALLAADGSVQRSQVLTIALAKPRP